MRHQKHHHQLGVKKEHRQALLANLAAALIQRGRISTTLAKAKALRPFIEKIITLAKKANAASAKGKQLHYRRIALARLRHKKAVFLLFNEKAKAFMQRSGGYTRIYKLLPRIGDAADMAIIECIPASDKGYRRTKRKKTASSPLSPEKTKAPRTSASSDPSQSADKR